MYFIEDDSGEYRKPLHENLEVAVATFKIESQHENCCMYLTNEDHGILLSWTGVQAEPNYEFVDDRTKE